MYTAIAVRIDGVKNCESFKSNVIALVLFHFVCGRHKCTKMCQLQQNDQNYSEKLFTMV